MGIYFTPKYWGIGNVHVVHIQIYTYRKVDSFLVTISIFYVIHLVILNIWSVNWGSGNRLQHSKACCLLYPGAWIMFVFDQCTWVFQRALPWLCKHLNELKLKHKLILKIINHKFCFGVMLRNIILNMKHCSKNCFKDLWLN